MRDHRVRCLFVLMSVAFVAACQQVASNPAVSDARGKALSAEQLIRRVYANAGGELWVRPRSLYMSGCTVFYRTDESDTATVVAENDRHRMWRIYPVAKSSAHAADGKVRIRSEREGAVVFDVAFDGTRTHQWNPETQAIRSTAEPADSQRWAANFGFGVIRHALDSGYQLTRLQDGLHQGQPAARVQITDPTGGQTVFAIHPQRFTLLSVGFDTPRGWHERHYSAYFSKEDSAWLQPGEVRLYYAGELQNIVYWDDYRINEPWPDALFEMNGEAALDEFP